MDLIRRRGTPEPDDFDKFWNLVKTGVVTVGAVGSVARPAFAMLNIGAEVISQVQGHFANHRSDQIVQDVAEDLYAAHQNHKLTIEQTQQVLSSAEFNAAVLTARWIATRTNDEEKQEALRGAVLHTALGSEPQKDRWDVFLSLVDFLQPVHLRLLKHRAPLTLTDKSTLSNVLELLQEKMQGCGI